jgi:hypothetical protein
VSRVRQPDRIGIVAVLTLETQNHFISLREVVDPDPGELHQTAAVDIFLSPGLSDKLGLLRVDYRWNPESRKRISRDGVSRLAQISFSLRRDEKFLAVLILQKFSEFPPNSGATKFFRECDQRGTGKIVLLRSNRAIEIS